eukprot:5376710-Pleurochrysis_carterae.AAC.1
MRTHPWACASATRSACAVARRRMGSRKSGRGWAETTRQRGVRKSASKRESGREWGETTRRRG